MRISIMMFVCCGLLAGATPARAGDEAAARDAFRQGRAAYKAGDYRAAVRALKRAYKLSRRPALLRYIGKTYEKMDRPKLALKYYRRYLKAAPEAADREKVEARISELEVALAEEEAAAPPPAPEPAPEPAPAPPVDTEPVPGVDDTARKASVLDMSPTGEDTEMPDALKVKPKRKRKRARRRASGGTTAWTIIKWVGVGLAVGGLGAGIALNRMAAADASELEDRVKGDCPEAQPRCGGNPTKSRPVVPFQEEHFNLQKGYQLKNTLSIVFFSVGGAAAALAVTGFILDSGSPAKERRRKRRRASVAPLIGGGVYGLSGTLTF